jgi:hypothetical protein
MLLNNIPLINGGIDPTLNLITEFSHYLSNGVNYTCATWSTRDKSLNQYPLQSPGLPSGQSTANSRVTAKSVYSFPGLARLAYFLAPWIPRNRAPEACGPMADLALATRCARAITALLPGLPLPLQSAPYTNQGNTRFWLPSLICHGYCAHSSTDHRP